MKLGVKEYWVGVRVGADSEEEWQVEISRLTRRNGLVFDNFVGLQLVLGL